MVANEKLHRNEYSIGDLARLYGVSLRTLRFYEDKGLLQPRRQAATRLYSSSDRVRLELILKGKRVGFTLAEIKALITARSQAPHAIDPENSDPTISLDMRQVEAQIAHLERQRSSLDEAIDELHRAHDRMARSAG